MSGGGVEVSSMSEAKVTTVLQGNRTAAFGSSSPPKRNHLHLYGLKKSMN